MRPGGARQLHARQVHRRDQEDQAHRGEEEEDDGFGGAVERVAQRLQRGEVVRLRRRGDARRRHRQVRLRARNRDARLEPAHGVDVMRAAIGPGQLAFDGNDRLCPLQRGHRGRRDAHQGEGHAVEEHGGAGRNAAEHAPPEALGGDQRRRRVGNVLFVGEEAPRHRLQPQHLEEPAAHGERIDDLRLASSLEVERLEPVDGESGEVGRLRAQILELRPGKPVGTDLRLHVLQRHQPFRPWKRQRPQEHRVHGGEDGGGGTERDGEREHRHRGGAGALAQHAHRELQVLKQRIHHSALKATAGSTRVARRAGSQLANTATAPRSAAMAA